MKKWFIYNKKAEFRELGDRFGIDQVAVRILRNREVNSEQQIESFLNGSLGDLHSPMLLPDAIRGMNRLDRAINEHRSIRIVGDYDVDGVCATYILYHGLKRLGAEVSYAIPDRIRDGYGINLKIIEEAKRDGIALILTCDNGISAIDELSAAKDMGISVIVTDHHDVRQNTDPDNGSASGDILPPAAAVIDPKVAGSRYPFPEICGAVVAWKLLQLLYEKRGMAPEDCMRYLEFAAIATVCDVVKLQDENRIIVKYGLRALQDTQNPGLSALIEVTGLYRQTAISAYHVGFVIGPCINAGGRLETAQRALELFLEPDRESAVQKAIYLKELNDARKEMTQKACLEAFSETEKHYAGDKVLAVYMPKLHESLAGIVAGRLREQYYRPSFVITDTDSGDETGMAKGSGRSIEGYPMFEKLSEAAPLLSKFGGHPMAAGFSLPRENIDAFRRTLNKNAGLSEEQLTEKLWIDVPMPPDYITEKLIDDLGRLEPFGQGNEKPKFAWKNITILEVRVLGRTRNAVRLTLETPSTQKADGKPFRFVGMLFMDGDRFIQEKGKKNKIDMVYYPVRNEYNGSVTLQLMIQDYVLHE